MSVPRVDQVAERPLQELVQTASQQAVGLAREQVDAARRDLTARASQAGPGVAMVGAGALLAALASGTGTAALILLLARRPGRRLPRWESPARMPVPARCWPAEGSCASGKPGRPCPTCRIETNRVRRTSKTLDLRSDALSRQPSRHRCPTCPSKTNRVSRPSKPSDPRSDAPSPQPSRHRSRPVARSRRQSQRVLAVAPPARPKVARGDRAESR